MYRAERPENRRRGGQYSPQERSAWKEPRKDDDEWEDVEELDSEEQVDEEVDEGSIGCAHYNRKCKVVAPCW